MRCVLEARSLVKRRGRRRVVDGVSLSLSGGETLALLGPNGAGKTTLVQMLAGAVRVDSGQVELDGLDVTRLPLHRRAQRGLGYLAQAPSVFRGLTVEANVASAVELIAPRGEVGDRTAELLHRFELPAIAGQRADRISGGEQRRTELARLMASDPRIILLDEPFAGLDPRGANDLERHLAGLLTEGRAVLISDHAFERALGLCNSCCVIAAGRIVARGSPGEVMNREDVAGVYPMNPQRR